jgi:hypothetical protein
MSSIRRKSFWTAGLLAVTLMCLVSTVAFGQDTVVAAYTTSSYTIGYYQNANVGLPDAQMHVINPGSTGGFEPTGDLCANIYVFTPDQQLAECCSCKVSPNGMQGFSLATDLTHNPLTSDIPHSGAIKIVSSSGGGSTGAGLPGFTAAAPCDAGSNYEPNGHLETWITHVRPLGTSLGAAVTVTETNFEPVDLSSSELNKLRQECYAIEASAGMGGVGSGAGVCKCDPGKTF